MRLRSCFPSWTSSSSESRSCCGWPTAWAWRTAPRRSRFSRRRELLASNKAYLTPCEVAGVLGTTDQQVRVCARQRPDLLGFPTIIMGSRVKIPRIPFLQYLGVKGAGEHGEE